ncbi:MAG TPA: TonB-dependent receptor [Methylovirgula sp.]|nr:TonB-dependent receptor [Methylovirgula sp.]
MRIVLVAVFFVGVAGPALAQQALPQVNVTAPAQSSQLDLTASPGMVQQTDELDRARQTIFTSIGANSYEINENAINDLPQGPNTPLDKVLLQAPGVSQDSAASGDLHVRNEHANVQYRINGVLLPDGVSGFGQVLETNFIGSLALVDGALPAEYGLHTAALVDIMTRGGASQPGGSISLYGGSHSTVSPYVTYGGTIGQTQFFVTGRLLTDDVGIENPTPNYDAIHDRTRQGRFFGYASTILDDGTRLMFITGTAINKYQIPNNPDQAPQFTAFGVSDFNSADLNENQVERNFYNVLAAQKTVGAIDAQISVFSRDSTLHFIPDPVGDLVFNGVASDVTRDSLLNGIEGDFADHLGPHTLRFGFYVSGEDTQALNSDAVLPVDMSGNPVDAPFTINDNSSKLGWLGSLYAQDEWEIARGLILNAGLRFDQMAEYVSANQVSPRVSLTYTPLPGTTFHAGYARYFTPPEQALAAPTNLALFANTTAAAAVAQNSPVQPERSNVFDAGVTQKLLPGLEAGVDAYYKRATNLLDDGQFGQALVLTAFNYARAYNTGVEVKANYQVGSLSAYANIAWARQRATQVSSNQYLFDPAELAYIASNYIYTDHDQTWTGSAGISYLWQATRFSADLIYGSGLRNGFANTGTVAPYTQVNLGVTHDFILPASTGLGPLTLRFDVVNLFDTVYQIRDGSGIGVFAPQYGPRRGFFGGLTQRF